MANLREQVNAIILRNSKELVELEKLKAEEPSVEIKEQTSKGEKYGISMRYSKGVGAEKKSSTYVATPYCDLLIPYPQRVKLKKKEQTEK